jgi:hypothetical protein
MKKLLCLLFTFNLILGLTTMTLAGTITLDVWGGGEYEYRTSDSATIHDLPQISLGLEFPAKLYKFAVNISDGKINDYQTDYGYADLDTASILLKGGYALVNNKKIRFDLTAGLFDREINYDYLVYSSVLDDYIDTESYYSLTVGLDAKIVLDKRAWLELSYSWGIWPQKERTYYYSKPLTGDLDSIAVINIKFNYLCNRRLGVALGYYCENIEFDLYNNKDKYSSVKLGAFWRF